MTTGINLWCWEVLKTPLTPFGMVSRKNKTATRPLVVNLMQSGTKVNMAAQYMIYFYWVTPECLVIVIPLNARLCISMIGIAVALVNGQVAGDATPWWYGRRRAESRSPISWYSAISRVDRTQWYSGAALLPNIIARRSKQRQFNDVVMDMA